MMRIIDLSHPINSDMPGVEITPARVLSKDGWNATTLSLYSHCGTHMDAPFHFLPAGETIDRQPLEALVGPATVVDISPAQPRQLISVDDVLPQLEQIEPGARMLIAIRTDWYKQYGTDRFRNELPRISLELAEWLVERKVALLGVEPPSVADVNNMQELTSVHQVLLKARIVIVEGLACLDQIKSDAVQFVALPLKVTGGDGSPVRAIAIEDE